jgi:hypothetical protein
MVKPIKVTSSEVANEFTFDEWLIIQTQTQLRATQTSVLRKANATVRREVSRFDLTDRGVDQFAELPPLLVADGGLEILRWQIRCATGRRSVRCTS